MPENNDFDFDFEKSNSTPAPEAQPVSMNLLVDVFDPLTKPPVDPFAANSGMLAPEQPFGTAPAQTNPPPK